ncbi:MAG: ImmA/IrrE family metallo-endopeptidase [Oscillospiraceae bacterium]|nr:ImmA/IrrE family metallo-endopeptidase [Oscillospiraceae bacterium]
MQHILDKAAEVLENYGGRNIFDTAENSGAIVWERELGGLKGFYLFENGFRYIVINEDLDKVIKAVVCAHELGHDMLHRELSADGIRENTLFLTGNKTEREANLFAAEILISDEDILDEISDHNSMDALSACIGMPAGLVNFKLEILNYKGYDFNCGESVSDFLR